MWDGEGWFLSIPKRKFGSNVVRAKYRTTYRATYPYPYSYHTVRATYRTLNLPLVRNTLRFELAPVKTGALNQLLTTLDHALSNNFFYK